MKYIIYKASNEHTGMAYVGATTKSIEERKQDHFIKAQREVDNKFYSAINTYGLDAFQWTQIDTAENLNDLAAKEKEYILKYNSKNEGYNSDRGGGFQKTVYQYHLSDGSLVAAFDSLEGAAQVINASKQQLSRACLSVNNRFKGYYWSYVYTEPFKPEKDKRKKSVLQLDSNEKKILNEFDSIAEAFELTGINKSSIAKVCRGERNHAGGYKWVYK
jgi:hypothetical protein